MRRTGLGVVVVALVAGLIGPAAAVEFEGRRHGELPKAPRQALERFVRALEVGDRAAALEELLPETHISATPLLGRLLATPNGPWAEARCKLLGWEPTEDGLHLRLLLTARAVAEREGSWSGDGLEPRFGYQTVPLEARWVEAAKKLRVQSGTPASVVAARVEWTLEDGAERVSVRSELELVPEVPGIDALTLFFPPSVDRARLLSPQLEAEWLRLDDDEDGGTLVLRSPEPLSAPLTVVVEHEGALPKGMTGGDTIYLPHAGAICAWAGGRFHTWDVTLDIPEDKQGVSIGIASELEAPEGRRRVRFATDRVIDYPGIAVGHFQVERRGPLELWRASRVGGSADKLLAELRTLVDFHEERVAPLPYGAFRLVQLDMAGAGAVSYASVIFMNSSVMATDKQRYAILSHEVAHQWWGNAVQGDQHTRWISEGMANALMDLFVEHVEGEDEKQDLLDKHRKFTLRELGPGALPLAHVRGRPADYYERGALFVHALKEVAGEETFWKILQAWYAEHSGPAVGTPAFRATAERVAGRSLAEVFEPWLESTALPVLEMEWSHEGSVASIEIRQDEPFFALEVPVEAMLKGGRSEWLRVPVSGASTSTTWELPEPPLALRMDPKQVTPRVREPELYGYLVSEAAACFARGANDRALRLMERAEELGDALPDSLLQARATALAASGRVEESQARLELDLPDATLPQELRALLTQVDALLSAGRAKQALRLAEAMSERVDDGAALHLRRAQALRMLDREAEAQEAWRSALEERRANEAARLALGLPGLDEEIASETVLEKDDARLDGNHPELVRLLAASDDRWGLVLTGSRRILLGRGDELEAVPDYSPSGLIVAVVVDESAAKPLVVALEGGRRRGRITVIEMDERGRGQVLARHERTPAKAQALVSDGSSVFVAFKNREGDHDWYRFLPQLRGSATEGPDDRDGLVTLKVRDDERFEKVATTPATERVLVLEDGTFAWLTATGVLKSESDVLWERLEGTWEPIHLRRAGAGAGLLLAGDLSTSPFEEDALPGVRLVVVDAERMIERDLPTDALQAVLAPDGSVLVLRGYAGCGGSELSVARIPAGP